MVAKLQRVFVPGAIFLSMVISIAVAQIPVTLRGAIESISSQTLAVKEHDGKITNAKLADDVRVFTLKQASLANLKRGGIVGTTAIQQMRGGQQAVEIYIFPNDPKHEPNDTVHSIIGRKSEVLSYTEGMVIDNVNQILTIKYPGGDKKMVIPTNVRVVMLVPASIAEIKVGQYCFAPNSRPTSLGALVSTIIVGSDRVDFAL